MSVNRVKQKINCFDDSLNLFDKKNDILSPGIIMVNARTLPAILFGVYSNIFFYGNYFFIQSKKIIHPPYIILTKVAGLFLLCTGRRYAHVNIRWDNY